MNWKYIAKEIPADQFARNSPFIEITLTFTVTLLPPTYGGKRTN